MAVVEVGVVVVEVNAVLIEVGVCFFIKVGVFVVVMLLL